MNKTYFIADTHFDHKAILSYEGRPFKSIDEMNVTLINNWNNTVDCEDVVFMLGDFAFSNEEKIKFFVDKLNGYKVLILGNHDKEHSYDLWKCSGFDEVISYPIIFKEWFILSHEPVYLNSNMPYANIFGHVHGNKIYSDFSNQSFCVCVERINYTPVEFNYIVEKMKKFKL